MFRHPLIINIKFQYEICSFLLYLDRIRVLVKSLEKGK